MGTDGNQQTRHTRPCSHETWKTRQEGRVLSARPGWKDKHFQNSRQIHECGERHQVRAACEVVSQLNRSRVAQCVHRGWHVRHQGATEKDFLDAVHKVIKSYAKFSATPKYMTYN